MRPSCRTQTSLWDFGCQRGSPYPGCGAPPKTRFARKQLMVNSYVPSMAAPLHGIQLCLLKPSLHTFASLQLLGGQLGWLCCGCGSPFKSTATPVLAILNGLWASMATPLHEIELCLLQPPCLTLHSHQIVGGQRWYRCGGCGGPASLDFLPDSTIFQAYSPAFQEDSRESSSVFCNRLCLLSGVSHKPNASWGRSIVAAACPSTRILGSRERFLAAPP